MRFELTTLTLARLCSTPELRPRSVPLASAAGGAGFSQGGGGLQEEKCIKLQLMVRAAWLEPPAGIFPDRRWRLPALDPASPILANASEPTERGMARTDELSDFVRQGLIAGRSRDELAAALAQAGWSGREVAQALDGWGVAPGLPPVPRPRAHVSAREGLVYGLLFLLLLFICWHITMLGFQVVDSTLPGLEDRYPPSPSVLRWNMAALIPAVPLFLWLNRRVAQDTARDLGRRRSPVRKWLAAVTLLLASLALLGDLVAVIYSALNGELTARFAAKAALIAVVGGLAFAFWRGELDDR